MCIDYTDVQYSKCFCLNNEVSRLIFYVFNNLSRHAMYLR